MFSIKKQYLIQTHFSYFSAEDFVQTPIYSLMEKAYLNILNNFDTLDEHYPDFVSFFQCRVLPIALQSGNFNQDLVRVAPTAFPPSVNPSEVTFVTKTVPIQWKYSIATEEEYNSCMEENEICDDPNEGIPSRNLISTRMYAVPGTIVTATFPSECTGKIEVSPNDQLMFVLL